MSKNTNLIIPGLGGLYDSLTPMALPLLRFCAGTFLAAHGAQKLFGLWGGNIAGTAGFFEKIGLSPGLPMAYLAGSIEFFGGLLVAIGLFTRPAAAACIGLLLVAAFKVHWVNGFFWNKSGVEYPFLWAIVMLVFFIRGGGEMSADKSMGREF